ncbi:hypothetical protein C6T66_12525 [Burkholderia multivorans]|uniref:Uncharacterized protein n=2 Tax=Burkholderia multivorans TaxID=87883 RepID=B9BV14_9BURK|nr:hypothetical protein BURMUCGD2_0403 [Burkholderia multivorans CGD2]EEE10956.1 hypothetical protein BURMUCGD2M_0399 [Burkholderia multivorans CGD2M]PRD86065.1 hypothetical protein C6P76_15630 [Burkholderia multivorans]PRE21991.1 hypothetical protein C6P79_28340 [Burkholderia multivorans]PRF23407.1 hypothetical protein C6P98_13765 [Burkholderia multivorans]
MEQGGHGLLVMLLLERRDGRGRHANRCAGEAARRVPAAARAVATSRRTSMARRRRAASSIQRRNAATFGRSA